MIGGIVVKEEIWCDTYDEIDDILQDEPITREQGYQVKLLLSKCCDEIIEKAKNNEIKNSSYMAYAMKELKDELDLDSNIAFEDPSVDFHLTLRDYLIEWRDHCKKSDFNYMKLFSDLFIDKYAV